MSKSIRRIFVYIFVFSVFSLTLQASIISICKESKVFKNQNQQIPLAEEEENHDGDESIDEDVIYLNSYGVCFSHQEITKLFWGNVEVNYLSVSKKITIPPPKP